MHDYIIHLIIIFGNNCSYQRLLGDYLVLFLNYLKIVWDNIDCYKEIKVFSDLRLLEQNVEKMLAQRSFFVACHLKC